MEGPVRGHRPEAVPIVSPGPLIREPARACDSREIGEILADSEMHDPAVDQEIERIRQIYHQDVVLLPGRRMALLGRKCQPQILYTFLGFELKMGRTRLNCPDMATARYLRVFAEIGMQEVQIPFDPSRVQILATGLEHALDRIKERLLEQNLDAPGHASALRRVYARIRRKLVQGE